VLNPDDQNVISFRKGVVRHRSFHDAETGGIKQHRARRKDPHLESLEFISSAGAWNANGDRIAFALVTKGRPGLGLLDVKKDKIVREIRLPRLGQIFNPSWSPDGRQIAFSALANGMSDIFIYDLQADSLHRVTNDFYSDLHPAWSPDGKQIALPPIVSPPISTFCKRAIIAWRFMMSPPAKISSAWIQTRQAHQPAMVAGWQEHLLHFGSRRHLEYLSRRDGEWQSFQVTNLLQV
jgi:WD40 repeat protein